LLIVIYERLGLIHNELRTIAHLLDPHKGDARDSPASAALNDASGAKETAHAK
jgi:hypothetical protein